MNPTVSSSSPEAQALRDRLARLQGFLEQDPDNLNLLAELADLALTLGEIPTARDAIDRALTQKAGDPYLLLRASSIALAAGNSDESLALTEGILAQGVDDAAVRFNQAFALLSLKRFEDAKPVLIALQEHAVDFPAVTGMLIRCHHYLGELDEAIAVAAAHLETHPDDAAVAGMLGLLYFDNDNLEQAKVWSDRAMALGGSPGIDTLLAAGGAALGYEDTDRAKSLLEQAVGVSPRNGRAWSSLGLAEMLEFDLPAARDHLFKATQYMPEHIGTWLALGWSQLLQQDVDGAEASFNAALAIDENFGETHGALAAIYATRGDWARAEASSKIARRLDPQGMSAAYTQILQMQRDGKGDLALKAMQGALTRGTSPAGGSLMDMVARIARKKKIN